MTRRAGPKVSRLPLTFTLRILLHPQSGSSGGGKEGNPFVGYLLQNRRSRLKLIGTVRDE